MLSFCSCRGRCDCGEGQLTKRGFFEAPLQPDRILIFQRAIEDECDSAEEIKKELKITLVHEIAHFFESPTIT
jgi:predicted Zn-dependent protease with MMP-like domain